MATFDRGGIAFDYFDRGQGAAFLFQHGLGGDWAQPVELAGDALPRRLIAMSCRGHGATDPLGEPGALSIATFADDVAALAFHLGLGRVVLGGISMGAALSLRLASRHPDLVERLVLVRPAWLTAPRPPHLEILLLVAAHLRRAGGAGVADFIQTSAYRAVAAESPDNATSLRRQFEVEDPLRRATVLERIVACEPGVSDADLARLRLPVLVIASGEDALHPVALARELAGRLPRAELRLVTSKSVDAVRHTAEVRQALAEVLGASRDDGKAR
jgi:pimeloyl-ACP methyl ester carboxylesterase